MKRRIERLSHEGFGEVRTNNKIILLPFSAAGDEVEIKKYGRRGRKLIATEYSVVRPSPVRIKPRCKYFGTCGGCMFQHLPYEEQVKFKKQQLAGIAGLDVEVIKSPKTYGYRNRIDIAVSTQGIGFRKSGSWHEVVDIDACKIFGGKSKKALKTLREFMKDFELKPWDFKKGEGFLRYMVLREGKFTDKLMVNLVTTKGEMPEVENYFDFANSIYWSINNTKSDVSFGEIERYWKKAFIQERLNDITYLIHPNSFFQTNPYQAAKLIKEVAKLVDGSCVLDLYCGIGSFSLYLAKKGFEVEGRDINGFSIEIARQNAKINEVEANFAVGKDKDVKNLSRHDTVIVDPPRQGLHPKLIKRLLKETPKTLIYVSCNPKTLAENLERLKEKYKVEEALALDMFPHTPHVEVVAKLVS